MSWPTPEHSKTKINKAGVTLTRFYSGTYFPEDTVEIRRAFRIVDNYRSCHGYPINTFNSTLRQKLKLIDTNALVAQRLKRMPSIVSKLQRFKSMKLARMQDVGGLRAVVTTLKKVKTLEENYGNTYFQHKLINKKDYIESPKPSGYRSVHLVYRYKNDRAPAYNGLCVELQIRTKLQHAWATAVETMGTFLDHALKSSEGPENWLNFFSLAGSAFAYYERTKPVPGYEHLGEMKTYLETLLHSKELEVHNRLKAFTIAAEQIHSDRKQGSYHLIILDLEKMTVGIQTYPNSALVQANYDYTKLEKRISDGEKLQAVLVSAGPIEQLRRAYPNYFLDTKEFIKILKRIENRIVKKYLPRSGIKNRP